MSNKKGAEFKGFTNHLWNGITTLEWCIQAEFLLETINEHTKCLLVQLGTKEHYSKYEMLQLFQEVFKTELEISKFETPKNVDKRLIQNINSENLKNQLIEMKEIIK